MKSDDLRTAHSILLLLISLLVALIGSFAASAAESVGLDIMWVVSLTGYAIGLVGAAKEALHERAYLPAALIFVIGIVVTCAQRFTASSAQTALPLVYLAMLWSLLNVLITVANFAAVYYAVGRQLSATHAPEDIKPMGRRWVLWTVVSLAFSFSGAYLVQMLPLAARSELIAQMTVLVLAFAFMVSAVVMGVRFLSKARKFYLTRSGGRK